MELSRSVTVTVPVTANKEYRVITSEDGINWSSIASGALIASGSAGRVSFDTLRFSYFALVLPTPIVPPTCSISATPAQVMNGGSVSLNWSTQNTISASLGGIGNQPISGSINVTPPNDTGTAYTLTVLGNGNTSSTCQVVVTATGYPPVVSTSGGGGSG